MTKGMDIGTIARGLLASPIRPVQTLDSSDGSKIFNYGDYETVQFPKGQMVCVSVQSGCTLERLQMPCQFCSTARYRRFARSLSGEQIASQAILAFNSEPTLPGSQVLKVLFAGMGDSGFNPHGLVNAIRILQAAYQNNPLFFFMTTIGAPKRTFHNLRRHIITAYDENRIQNRSRIVLQLSIHAATDEKRTFIIPASKDYPLKELLADGLSFRDELESRMQPMPVKSNLPTQSLVVLNHLMLGPRGDEFVGNAHPEDLGALTALLQEAGKENFLVQLCDYNADERDGGHSFGTIPETTYSHWIETLTAGGIMALRFRSKGTDVRGGCGQLTGNDCIEEK